MLKIGELTSGLFAGDKLIAGKEFDIKQLVDNITFADDLVHEEINTQLVLICNLSSIPIYLYRDSERIEIKKQHIEWYSFGAPTAISLDIADSTGIFGLGCVLMNA